MNRENIVSHGLLPLAVEIAKFHRVKLEDMISGRRRGRIVEARHHFIYEARDAISPQYVDKDPRRGAPRGWSETAEIIGMDHTSVVYAYERWAKICGDIGFLSPRGRR